MRRSKAQRADFVRGPAFHQVRRPHVNSPVRKDGEDVNLVVSTEGAPRLVAAHSGLGMVKLLSPSSRTGLLTDDPSDLKGCD